MKALCKKYFRIGGQTNFMEFLKDKWYQKRVLRLNRIFKLYNILQKIKDRKNEQNEGCNK
jgi:hypothetical protein